LTTSKEIYDLIVEYERKYGHGECEVQLSEAICGIIRGIVERSAALLESAEAIFSKKISEIETYNHHERIKDLKSIRTMAPDAKIFITKRIARLRGEE